MSRTDKDVPWEYRDVRPTTFGGVTLRAKNRAKTKYHVGPGGPKCSCCNPAHGQVKQARRHARRTSRLDVRVAAWQYADYLDEINIESDGI